MGWEGMRGTGKSLIVLGCRRNGRVWSNPPYKADPTDGNVGKRSGRAEQLKERGTLRSVNTKGDE